MKLQKLAGATSEIWQVFIRDSSSTTGAGLTGLVFNSASLTAYYNRDTDASPTAITLVTMTAGTFTSSGFKEISSANMPGWYQFCPPNAALASGAKSVGIHLKGATNMAPCPIEVQLLAVNIDDAVRMGMTALPNAAAEAAGGLYTRGTGAGQINQDANGRVDANAKAWAGTATTLTSGLPDVNMKTITAGIIAAASFASGALDAVWSTTARLLTAGTNIVLAKGTGVTGFNDLDAAGVRTAVGLASANLDTQLAALQSDTDNIQTRLPAALVSGRIDASVGAMASGVVTAAAIAADAITDAKVASDVTIASVTGAVGSVTGAVGSVTGNVGGSVASVASGGITAASFAADAITAAKIAADVTTELQAGLATAASIAALNNLSAAQVNAEVDTALADYDAPTKAELDAAVSPLATAANLATVAGYIDTEIGTIITNLATVDTVVDAIKVSTDKIDDTVEDDAGTFRFTANALEQAPTGGSAPTVGQIADEVQGRTIAAVTTVNGLAANSVTAAALATDAVTEIQTGLATASALSTVSGKIDTIDDFLDTEVAAILADTNELQTDWANGGRLDNILDARASQTSVDDIPTNAELATALGTADDAVLAQVALVKAKTDNLPSDPADQSLIIAATDALATLIGDVPTNAELATALAGADDAVLAQVALVKAKTDNLPSDPADQSLMIAATDAIIAGVDAIKAKTDDLTFTKPDELDVNMLSINGTALTGDGSVGDKFGPA